MKSGLMEYHTTMKELGWYNIKAVRKSKYFQRIKTVYKIKQSLQSWTSMKSSLFCTYHTIITAHTGIL